MPAVFWELHRGLLRQGPGDDAHTRRAFQALKALPDPPRIVDVGCGPGMQTLELARLSGSSVIAVDKHEPFLEELRNHAERRGLAGLIETRVGDMRALPFAPDSVDLFWSEGAIYIMGFESGLKTWRPMLRRGGCVAVTEATWIKSDPPEPVVRFWAENYPDITTAEGNVRRAEACGYGLLDHFVLPPEAWWTHYYTPIEERLPEMRRRYAHDSEAMAILDAEAEEIDLFRRYSNCYGYVFYVLQRQDEGDSPHRV
jgi:SAM-dependent methyltransferase